MFWPGEFHGTVHGVTKSQTRLSNFHFHKSEYEGRQQATTGCLGVGLATPKFIKPTTLQFVQRAQRTP